MTMEADAPRSIVVVGASLAGLNVAESLRQEGYEGALTLVGAEDRPPYDRPPLSKQVLAGEWPPERAQLRTQAELDALRVEWRLGTRATGLDVAARRVALADGESIAFDRLCIATGASPRTLPGADALPGVVTLRTLDDAVSLAAAFEAGPRVAVVGAGFIGLEVAAVARTRGLAVTVIEALGAPLERALGAEMGAMIGRLHVEQGVDLRVGRSVAGFEGSARVEGVRLDDGSVAGADVVVVGVGVSPNTGWLEGSGLELRDGVVCDQFCRAAPGVFAAGDVARWHNPLFGQEMRVEHWTNAVEQGMAVAGNMLAASEGEMSAYGPVPYFWSDQYDTSVLFGGWVRGDEEVRVVHGGPGERRVVALYGRAGRLTGVLSLNWPRRLREYQGMMREGVSWEGALERAGELG